MHVAVLVTSLAYFVVGAGRGSLDNSDDAIASAAITEISQGRSMLDLTFQGGVEHQRPMTFFWLAALVVRALGPTEFALRLWPAIGLGLCAYLAFVIARERGASFAHALVPATLLCALYVPIRTSRRVSEDALLSAAMAAALWSYLRTRRDARAWTDWAIFFGLAIMLKGVVAVFVVLPVAIDLALDPAARRDSTARRAWLRAIGLATLIAAPWHLLQTARFGLAFWRDYIGFNVLDRMLDAHPRWQAAPTSIDFYLRDLWTHDSSLSLFILLGLLLAAWDFARERESWTRGRVIALAALLPLLAFSLSRARLSHYALPIYVPLCVLAGTAFARRLKPPFAIATSLLLMLSGTATHAQDLLHPDYAPNIRAVGLALRARTAPTDTVYAFSFYPPGIAFYAQRRTELISYSAEAIEHLNSVPLLERSRSIRAITPDALAALAAQPACFVVNEAFEPTLAPVLRAQSPVRERMQFGSLAMWCPAK